MAFTHHCLIHGLVLASEIELPARQISPRAADVYYRVALGGELPEPTHSRSNEPENPWAIEHWFDNRLSVEFPARATFELSRDEILLVADQTNDSDLVAHLLLDHALPRVISLRGDLMLHAAGAVGPSGQAHLFLGKTGAGKSTIATDLAADGWGLLDDDGIRVVEDDGVFRAMPGAGQGVRLLPDTAAAVLPGVTPGPALFHGSPKHRFSTDGDQLRMTLTAATIAAVYLLDRGGTRDAKVERLGPGDSIQALVENAFHMADEPASVARQAFVRASALAAAVPVWRLCEPDGLQRLAPTRALIAKLDRES